MDLKIIRPHIAFKTSFLEGLRQFQAEGLPWFQSMNYDWIEENFEEYIEGELSSATSRAEGLVPETKFWGIFKDEYAGKISIRHELNDSLRVMGGHIGYDTVPSFRGRGIGSQMLSLVLPEAKSLGLKRVLLTCDDNNFPSIRIIEKNGGKLERKAVLDPGKPLKRYYWIEL